MKTLNYLIETIKGNISDLHLCKVSCAKISKKAKTIKEKNDKFDFLKINKKFVPHKTLLIK